jgi:hypothetical protein
MSEHLRELLADSATALVQENFTGVSAPWWWERRLGGGIEVCQEFDPEGLAADLYHRVEEAVKRNPRDP